MTVALGICVEYRLFEWLIACVVHPQHHRDNGWLVGEDVACEPAIDRTASAPRDAITTPAGMDERNFRCRKSRDDVSFGKGRVKPLVRDAVAVKDDAISILDRERRICPESRCQREAQTADRTDQTSQPHSSFHRPTSSPHE